MFVQCSMNWQTRLMYYTWQKAQAMDPKIMKAFTRVLHRTSEDELMHEVPTKRFDPVRPECDDYCDFPVADRAAALRRYTFLP